MKKIPRGAEVANVWVGEIDDLKEPITAIISICMSPSIPMTGMLKILLYFILNAIDFNFRNFGKKTLPLRMWLQNPVSIIN
jgi:hypothetical protein